MYAQIIEHVNSSKKVIAANVEDENDLRTLVLQTLEYGHQLPESTLDQLTIEELLAHLKLSHRYYLNTKLPEIEQSIYACYAQDERVDNVLLILCSFFIEYKAKLIEHIRLEERTLFPYIESLLHSNFSKPKHADEQFLDFSIAKFESLHHDLEDDLSVVSSRIKKGLEKIDLPFPFRIFLTQLELFEKDMAVHAYLEDIVLVPKVLQLELSLKKHIV